MKDVTCFVGSSLRPDQLATCNTRQAIEYFSSLSKKGTFSCGKKGVL